MNKNILKNSWILAVMIVLISTAVNFIAGIFIDMSGVIAVLATLFSAMFAGQLYSIYFKELMPKILRLKVALNYLCIQVAVVCLYLLAFEILELWLLIVLAGLSLIASAVVYWAIGWGGRMQLKSTFSQSI